MSAWRVGTVSAVKRENPTGRSITFDVPDWMGSVAGQHLDVRLSAPDGYQAVRSYSLASAGPDSRAQIAVDRLPDGEVSPYLVEELVEGDEVEVRGPLGGWFVWKPEQEEPVQLIGGGSGIVPLVAMVRAHRLSASAAPMKLLYSLRGPDDAFFATELVEQKGVPVEWVYSRHTPDGWPTQPGRISRESLERGTIPAAQNPTIYVCGPTGFVESVASWLIELGHKPVNVRTERFGGK